jgi:hypothetical protein
MTAPSWLTGTFAVMMLAVAGYCVVRLGVAWWWRRVTEVDTDGVHVIMGVAMAGMLAGGPRILPAGAWAAVFGASAGWFGWQAVRARRGVRAGPWRCSHPLPHVVESLAMVYMLLGMHGFRPAGAAGLGPGGVMRAAGGHLPVVALALAVYSAGYVVWLGDRVTSRAAVAVPAGAVPETWCKIAMGVTMGYMLILMV